MSISARIAARLSSMGLPMLAAVIRRCAGAGRARDPAGFHRRVDLALECGDGAEAARLCAERLDQFGDDRDARLRFGHLLLAEGRVTAALAHFLALDAIEGRRDVVTEVLTNERLDMARTQRGEPFYMWLTDVRVETAYWTIASKGRVYNDDVHAKNMSTSPFVQGRVSADGTMVIATLPPPYREIGEECILVGGDDNYSHWLFRNMLKLSTLDRAGLLYAHPWLVNSDLKNYQAEYIRLLGQRPERLIKVDRHQVIACTRVLVPALHIGAPAVTQGVTWLRERLSHLLVAPAQATRRLFVSRRDSTRRSVLNEDEVFQTLAPLGFERVVPGEMSVAEQVTTFSAARCVVGAHGAALTNMIFSRPGATIVELTSGATEHMSLFRKLARCMHQNIITNVSADYPVPAGEVGYHTDYRVDAKAVRAAVAGIL
jgi:capsular polysaccharide biosynthesis protein